MPGSGFKALQMREASLPPVLLVRQPVLRKIRQLAQAHPDNKRSNPKWYPVLLRVSITPILPRPGPESGCPAKAPWRSASPGSTQREAGVLAAP